MPEKTKERPEIQSGSIVLHESVDYEMKVYMLASYEGDLVAYCMYETERGRTHIPFPVKELKKVR